MPERCRLCSVASSTARTTTVRGTFQSSGVKRIDVADGWPRGCATSCVGFVTSSTTTSAAGRTRSAIV